MKGWRDQALEFMGEDTIVSHSCSSWPGYHWSSVSVGCSIKLRCSLFVNWRFSELVSIIFRLSQDQRLFLLLDLVRFLLLCTWLVLYCLYLVYDQKARARTSKCLCVTEQLNVAALDLMLMFMRVALALFLKAFLLHTWQIICCFLMECLCILLDLFQDQKHLWIRWLGGCPCFNSIQENQQTSLNMTNQPSFVTLWSVFWHVICGIHWLIIVSSSLSMQHG